MRAIPQTSQWQFSWLGAELIMINGGNILVAWIFFKQYIVEFKSN